MRKDNELLKEASRRLDDEIEQEKLNQSRVKAWRCKWFHKFNELPKNRG